jgi:hypothetical protein
VTLITIDDPLDLPLKRQSALCKCPVCTIRPRPFPACEKTLAFGAEHPKQTRAQPERSPQVGTAFKAAVPQHLFVNRANNPFNQPPISPNIGVPPRRDIRIKAGKTYGYTAPSRTRNPIARPVVVPKFQ